MEYPAPQVRDTPDSGDMRTEKEQRVNRPAHSGSARGEGRALGEGARGETAGCSRASTVNFAELWGSKQPPRSSPTYARAQGARLQRG